MLEQSVIDKPKPNSLSYQSESGIRYRYIDDTPLVPMAEAGKANGTNTASSASGAKTRSRPNNEYVLYSYGEPVAMSADGNASYFSTDILGSVRSITDKYGTVQADYSYDAFGNPYLGNLDNGMSFGYTGKAYDAGTGLYDYGFRDYSPNNARFTTVDPIRDGSNWFSYVVNDPVNYVDPLGLNPFSNLIDGAKERFEEAQKLPGKAKEALQKEMSEVKAFIKDNIKTKEQTYLQNDSDLWAAGAIETVEPDFELTQDNIDKRAELLLAAPHGGKTRIEVDAVTYIGKGDVNDTSTWQYAGVTDGNAIIVYGDKESGYNVRTKNLTKKPDSIGLKNFSIKKLNNYFNKTIANTASKIFTKKGPYDGLDNAKGIKSAWIIDNRNPEGAAPLINLRAQEMAQKKNQEILRLNGNSVSPTSINSSKNSTINFSNITFDSSGVAYIGFNGFSGVCTK